MGREFREFCESYFIKLVHSTPYNHSSNGGAESAINICKEIIKREGFCGLQRGLLSLNTTVKQSMGGSPMDMFIGRPSKSLLPGSRERRVDVEEIKKQRLAIQQRLQDKPRNSYRKLFEIGEQVKVQDPLSRRWDKTGEIIEKLINSDGSVTSYNVRANGRVYFRSARHLMKLKTQTPAAA